MSTASHIKATLFAAAILFAVGMGGSAHAAMVTPLHPQAAASAAKVTPVYWIWRHHHKIWVPSHHRGY